MLKYFKGKFTNFATYMLGLDKQLANAKNDAERVRILTQIAEAQKQQIEELSNENFNLNERLKDEVESIVSGSSSNKSINSQRDRERVNILKKIQKEKGSTATNRKLLKFLDEIERLEQEKQALEDKINNMTNPLTKALKELQTKLNEKLQEILKLNDEIKKLKTELAEAKTERDELKVYKTTKEAEEKEALEIIGEMDTSIDQTFANIEIPPKQS